MPAKNTGYSVRLWLSLDQIEHVKRLSEATQLSQVEVMNRIMSAGVSAVVHDGYRISLPLQFKVADEKKAEGKK